MADEPITLRGFFQSIGDSFADAGESMVRAFNLVLDADLTFIFQIIGIFFLLAVVWFSMTEFFLPPLERKAAEWKEAKRMKRLSKRRRDLGYDDKKE